MTLSKRVLVVGATGFVGSAVVEALETSGHSVSPLHAPRLPPMDASEAADFISTTELVAELSVQMTGFDAVINAAGNPDASERNVWSLTAANGVLVGVLAAAANGVVGECRFVHVSSAVVQGRRLVLDESMETDPFSAYAASKILGESLALRYAPDRAVVYRPPSVHARDRRVTRLTARVARSAFASVASPPDAPSPQALLPNVGSAVAFLATSATRPPSVVIHPWEGQTTSGLMRALGGREPRVVPRPFARLAVGVLQAVGRSVPRFTADARRVEMLWFGQGQATSWLEEAGWSPPAGPAEWQRLGEALRDESEDS